MRTKLKAKAKKLAKNRVRQQYHLKEEQEHDL
jgi:hypothetical protein